MKIQMIAKENTEVLSACRYTAPANERKSLKAKNNIHR